MCVIRVFFRGVTWLRDSHGLFDYESRNINKTNLKTQSDGKILRVNNDIEFVGVQKSVEDYLEVTPDAVKTVLTLKQQDQQEGKTLRPLIFGLPFREWVLY
jgi:hypothetical protein